jgi:hypothetical protein
MRHLTEQAGQALCLPAFHEGPGGGFLSCFAMESLKISGCPLSPAYTTSLPEAFTTPMSTYFEPT